MAAIIMIARNCARRPEAHRESLSRDADQHLLGGEERKAPEVAPGPFRDIAIRRSGSLSWARLGYTLGVAEYFAFWRSDDAALTELLEPFQPLL